MKSDDDAGQSLQRVKVGLTGLALVLLLIALASAVSRSAARRPPAVTAKSDAVANLSLVNSADPAGEPLAQIGVAPAGRAESPPTGVAARR